MTIVLLKKGPIELEIEQSTLDRLRKRNLDLVALEIARLSWKEDRMSSNNIVVRTGGNRLEVDRTSDGQTALITMGSERVGDMHQVWLTLDEQLRVAQLLVRGTGYVVAKPLAGTFGQ